MPGSSSLVTLASVKCLCKPVYVYLYMQVVLQIYIVIYIICRLLAHDRDRPWALLSGVMNVPVP
jgi:uncharacterized membrane protein